MIMNLIKVVVTFCAFLFHDLIGGEEEPYQRQYGETVSL